MKKNGDLVSIVKENAEVLNNIFTSVFTDNLSPRPSRGNGLQDGDEGGKAPSSVREDHIRDHLRNMNIHKTMRCDKMCPRALRELADGITKTLSMIFERSWQ